MRENKFSTLNENELMEINGGIDPATIVAIIGASAGVITATAELVKASKK
ncbi:class IIb bacteriocin, lactobin A/cerein 7B family [bacterium]|nr:class IIb bacteriocin, lactobin A/cerein 7B family [bacterium]